MKMTWCTPCADLQSFTHLLSSCRIILIMQQWENLLVQLDSSRRRRRDRRYDDGLDVYDLAWNSRDAGRLRGLCPAFRRQADLHLASSRPAQTVDSSSRSETKILRTDESDKMMANVEVFGMAQGVDDFVFEMVFLAYSVHKWAINNKYVFAFFNESYSCSWISSL